MSRDALGQLGSRPPGSEQRSAQQDPGLQLAGYSTSRALALILPASLHPQPSSLEDERCAGQIVADGP